MGSPLTLFFGVVNNKLTKLSLVKGVVGAVAALWALHDALPILLTKVNILDFGK